MERAERTIDRVEQARAGQYASNELSQAKQKLQAANSALLEKDTVSADRYAIEATLDAELAQARAKLAQANSVNDEMKNNISILQQEMLRRTKGIQQWKYLELRRFYPSVLAVNLCHTAYCSHSCSL